MNLRTRTITVLVPALAVTAAIALSGCGGSSDASTSKQDSVTTTAPAASDVKVTQLDVPATLDCNGKTSVDLTVAYTVEGAKRQELYVDGRKVDGTDKPSGSVATWVHCDPLPHTIDVVGYDAGGRHTTLEKKISTNL